MKDNQFILLENWKIAPFTCRLFSNPCDEICVTNLSEITHGLQRIIVAQQQGYWVVGYISYDVGLLCASQLVPHDQPTTPLLHFLLFDTYQDLTLAERDTWCAAHITDALPFVLHNLQFDLSRDAYDECLRYIKAYLTLGDSYQINFTHQYTFELQGDPLKLYHQLYTRQSVAYAGFLQFGDYQILTLSPELFFHKKADQITLRPMKGTVPRATDPQLDQYYYHYLASDPKNRAENTIIVDLLRNDLSRIAHTGSVQVKEYCAIENYETVYQMTSTITGLIDQQLSFDAIIQALFPCGSITGAPKMRTMEIIRELESRSRGIYTGCIGFIAPNNDMCFNVAIRTLNITQQHGTLGVGGGITITSEPSAEWHEMHLKANFMTQLTKKFSLLETMYWSQTEGYTFLIEHLARLSASADCFGFMYDLTAIQHALNHLTLSFTQPQYKVQLILNANGDYQLTPHILLNTPPQQPVAIQISKHQIDARNILWQHKTTHASTRGFYQQELTRLRQTYDTFEVLFQNQQGYLTEGTRFNIIIAKNNEWLTPPLSAGVLPGIYRQHLLTTKRCRVADIQLADLENADNIFLINSVRGMLTAKWSGCIA